MDSNSEQADSEQTALPDKIKSLPDKFKWTLKNMIKETIAEKIGSNLIKIDNKIENKSKDKM